VRYEAYMSLIDHAIRQAWLHHLYLDHGNFESVAGPLYIATASSNIFVRSTLSHQLRTAASEEILKTNTFIDREGIYLAVDRAFRSLSTLLGEDDYFFGKNKPGLFDASFFAYGHLLLSEKMRWQSTRLSENLKQYDNLAQFCERIATKYFTN